MMIDKDIQKCISACAHRCVCIYEYVYVYVYVYVYDYIHINIFISRGVSVGYVCLILAVNIGMSCHSLFWG